MPLASFFLGLLQQRDAIAAPGHAGAVGSPPHHRRHQGARPGSDPERDPVTRHVPGQPGTLQVDHLRWPGHGERAVPRAVAGPAHQRLVTGRRPRALRPHAVLAAGRRCRPTGHH